MAASSSIQFYGIDQVMHAAENRGCPAWGIWQSRQFMFRYQDGDIGESLTFLQEILNSLAANNTTATYTIKFFEKDGNKPIIIKENTPCDGSFNFKLVQPEERQQMQIAYQNNNPRLIGLLESMDERLKRLEGSDDDIEEEPETPLQVIGAILKDPQLLDQYVTIGKKLFNIPDQPNYVGNVNRMGQTSERSGPADLPGIASLSQQNNTTMATTTQENKLTDEVWLQRVGDALDVIREKLGDKTVTALEALAKLPKEKLEKIESLIPMLAVL
jgi:hypothetical protein